MMQLTYTGRGRPVQDLTEMVIQLVWSGDKLAIGRTLEGSLACTDDLPVPEIGDRLQLYLHGQLRFSGRILTRSRDADSLQLEVVAYDDAYHLGVVEGTYKWTGASPEAITRTVAARLGLPVTELPDTGISIRRKFAGVPLRKILQTVWTLAGERMDRQYAIRCTPAGLAVVEQGTPAQALRLADTQILTAMTREDASHMVNSVAIYDSKGNLLRRTGDQAAQQLVGLMERHIRQTRDGAAEANAQAKRMLEEGVLQRIVNIAIPGDPRILTGSTVVVDDPAAGLSGLFWVDADRQVWKNGQLTTRLTLNCRNVTAKADAGSKVEP